jgi:hypothetical protein
MLCSSPQQEKKAMTTAESILLILDPTGQEHPDACSGPTAGGACPNAVPGQPVPCAGHELVPAHATERGRTRIVVPAGADECPIPIIAAGGG